MPSKRGLLAVLGVTAVVGTAIGLLVKNKPLTQPPGPPPPPTDKQKPDPPEFVHAEVSGTDITVTWKPATAGVAPTAYDVHVDDGTGDKLAGTVTAPETTLVLRNATKGATYCVTIYAKNAAGSSAVSQKACVTVPSAPPTVQPKGDIVKVQGWKVGQSVWADLGPFGLPVPVGQPFALLVQWQNTSTGPFYGRIGLFLTPPGGSFASYPQSGIDIDQSNQGLLQPGDVRAVRFSNLYTTTKGTYSVLVRLSTVINGSDVHLASWTGPAVFDFST